MDREIISPDMDGSCDVYSYGLLICVFIYTHGIFSPRLAENVTPIYCVTFIVEFTHQLLLQQYNITTTK